MPARSEPPRRLVFLHGFTQTHHHWHRCAHLIADGLGDDPTLAFVDLPGHGLSAGDRSEIVQSGPPLVELVGAGTYIGYSMGGRFALTAALARGGVVRQLVLIGATPGFTELADAQERRRVDSERADRLEQIGVDAFLDEWLAAPLFATLPTDRYGLEYRRRNTVGGLAHSLRWCGTGNMGATMWAALERIPIPVLVIAGELDGKFTTIGQRMVATLPNGTFAPIAGAGHAAHTERPDEVSATIADWLSRQAA
jgi:2-succinyl-6-hydroxy-2,4-cyclohexadiene-1-carboxylate synthase